MARAYGPLEAAIQQRSLWSPERLGPTLTTYVNANRPHTITMATGVSTLRNLGSNGSTGNFTQGTGAAQPTISRLSGGQAMLSFTTSQNLGQASGSSGVSTGATTYTLAVLARMQASGTRRRIFASIEQVFIVGWHGGNKNILYVPYGFNAAGTADDREWHVYVFRNTATTPLLRGDGATITTTGTAGSGPGGLQFNGAASGETSDCDVAAAMAADTALSQQDIERLEGAWMWEFGLQSRLAVSHPYRASPPLIGG